MPQPSTSQRRGPEAGSQEELHLRFESAEALREEYSQNLASGALFVRTEAAHAPREEVEVVLELAFCGRATSVSAEVVVVVDAALAEAGGTSAGVSLRLLESVSKLRSRLEELSGISLEERPRSMLGERRLLERRGAEADIRLDTQGGQFWGVTANISYAGVLALLWRTRIPIGTEVRTVLSNPVVELELSVDGKIIHRTHCDDGMIAHGIQLHYPADRIDEVMSFVDFLQSFDRARRLASISGEIDASGVGAVLEMFASTSPSGTLLVSHGEEEGKIVFSDDEILHCTLGMVSGLKALSRMFHWRQGHFEFHHDLQLSGEVNAPQPLGEAMMRASVQVDEMARVDREVVDSTAAFEAVPEPPAGGRDLLTDIEREVLEFAADGFTADSIADMVAVGDAEVYRALSALLAGGWIRRRGE
jgi:Tfp pilus assembly protein PilZ